MDTDQLEKPLLTPTSRGFSVLYRGKYLYSKYNPPQAINRYIEQLEITDSTLFLCFSPVLPYGLTSLLGKLPESAYVLAVECDQALMRLSLDNGERTVFAHQQFSYIRTDAVSEVIHKIESLPLFPFKKCVCIPCSGGVQLYQTFYTDVRIYAEEIIARFWQNRITLMHLGRNYVHNTFRNLISLCDAAADTGSGSRLFGSSHQRLMLTAQERIYKPIIVAGAGPSLDQSRDFIRQHRSELFVLAVDAAAPALLPDIIPDAIVLVESQYWIDAAFIGLRSDALSKTHTALHTIPLFADITASPRALRAAGGQVFHFCTDYAPLHYLTRIYSALQPLVLQPMGSVGLTAVQLALRLTEPDIPVFHTGLDFTWQDGLTHARGSSPVQKLFTEITRTESLYKLNIPPDVRLIRGKQGLSYRTTTILSGYAELYRHAFADNSRVIDIGQRGCTLSTRLPETSEHEAAQQLAAYTAAQTEKAEVTAAPQGTAQSYLPLYTHDMHKGYSHSQAPSMHNQARCTQLEHYLTQEWETLTTLAKHLQGQQTISEQEIPALLTERDYLYSHFPDAARGYIHNLGFLKRVSIELRSILKLLEVKFGSPG